MKRDMDLIRKMVLAVEECPSGFAPELKIQGYDTAQIGYHAYLLVNSGLAEGFEITTTCSNGPEYQITHLTSAGHDFAGNVRNEYIWDEVLEEIKKKGLVSAGLDAIKKLLDKVVRKRLDVG